MVSTTLAIDLSICPSGGIQREVCSAITSRTPNSTGTFSMFTAFLRQTSWLADSCDAYRKQVDSEFRCRTK